MIKLVLVAALTVVSSFSAVFAKNRNVFFDAIELNDKFALNELQNSEIANEVQEITKFEVGNIEVSGLDNGKYKFKRNICSGGYSYFSPYNEKPEVLDYVFDAKENNSSVEIFSGSVGLMKFKDFILSEDKSFVSFNLVKDNIMFTSKIYGKNLSVEFIKNTLLSLKNTKSVSHLPCPPCIVIIVGIVAGACTEAAHACTPCNGILQVNVCSCQCIPRQQP